MQRYSGSFIGTPGVVGTCNVLPLSRFRSNKLKDSTRYKSVLRVYSHSELDIVDISLIKKKKKF